MRCLFALSADFGEFVTANLLSRGQPFERLFALPPHLAPYAGGLPHAVYRDAGHLEEAIDAARPDVVVLGSGYLFAINNLFGPGDLQALLARLRHAGVAVATTDPWLRLRALRPEARFSIRSLQKGAVDAAQSERILALQRRLEDLLADLPHLLAVPVPGPAHARLGTGAFNRAFSDRAPKEPGEGSESTWLFVLAREDLALMSPEGFFDSLEARMRELLAVPANRLRFIAPPRVGEFLTRRFEGEPRVEVLPFCDFRRFEAEVRAATVVAYWNVLSASALYCLYHGVAPVFFGRGHQCAVLEGLFEHAIEHVYRGRPPALFDLNRPFESEASRMIRENEIRAWLEALRGDYEKLPEPSTVLERLCNR